MADYKAIKGHTIQTVAGDPGTLAPGLIWYDSVAKKIQGSKLAAGSWASGGNLSTARSALAAFGTQTAALAAGGYGGPDNVAEVVEQYDGSSWTEVGDINTGNNDAAGCGTVSAGVKFGGQTSPSKQTEEWNGTAWTASGAMNIARAYLAGLGTQTASFAVAGKTMPATDLASGETFNGSTWSNSPASINTTRAQVEGVGTTTAALIAGGILTSPGAVQAVVESWNGSAWTEVGDLNSARANGGMHGTQAGCVYSCGNPASALCEEWDGSSWSETTNNPLTSYGNEGAGTAAAGLSVGGYAPGGNSATVSEWTVAASVETIAFD